MTTKDKIKKYLDFKEISKNRFYTITGLSSSFLDSGNTIGADKIKIIIENFPDLSLEWLVMDVGPMLRSDEPKPPIQTIVYERDPRDIQLIAAQEKIIACDEKLIAALERQVRDLERGSKSVGLGSARSVATPTTPGINPARK